MKSGYASCYYHCHYKKITLCMRCSRSIIIWCYRSHLIKGGVERETCTAHCSSRSEAMNQDDKDEGAKHSLAHWPKPLANILGCVPHPNYVH